MSAFSDLWNEYAAPLLTEQFAGEAFCTQPGISKKAVPVSVWPLEVTEEKADRGVNRTYTRLIGVPRNATAANGGNYIAVCGMDDLWTVDGRDFTVDAIESQTESQTVLRLKVVAAHEATRQGLRRRT